MPFNLRGPELLVFFFIFTLPAIAPIVIAFVRRTTNRIAVLIIALLLSWTCVGWVVALIMSLNGTPEKQTPPASGPSEPAT